MRKLDKKLENYLTLGKIPHEYLIKMGLNIIMHIIFMSVLAHSLKCKSRVRLVRLAKVKEITLSNWNYGESLCCSAEQLEKRQSHNRFII